MVGTYCLDWEWIFGMMWCSQGVSERVSVWMRTQVYSGHMTLIFCSAWPQTTFYGPGAPMLAVKGKWCIFSVKGSGMLPLGSQPAPWPKKYGKLVGVWPPKKTKIWIPLMVGESLRNHRVSRRKCLKMASDVSLWISKMLAKSWLQRQPGFSIALKMVIHSLVFCRTPKDHGKYRVHYHCL